VDRRTRIEETLRRAFAPVELEVEDDSHRHRGHKGAGSGGHFRVTLVSARFAGISRLERHRLVYEALRTELGAEIHALALSTRAPGEPES
jgi:BolA protein